MTPADLTKRALAARAHADELAAAALAAKDEARKAADVAVALEAELDLEQWVAVQEAAGHPRETLDLNRRIVTALPIGPVYG